MSDKHYDNCCSLQYVKIENNRYVQGEGHLGHITKGMEKKVDIYEQ